MSNYNLIKNASILAPSTSTDIGTNTNPVDNIFMSGNLALGNTIVTSTNVLTPKVASLGYPNNATAAELNGGETITLTGSGFQTGLGVYLDNTIIAISTVVSSGEITFTSPAKSAGNYPITVINPDGGTATFLPGITYSALPNWATAAGNIANVYEYDAVSVQLSANSDSNITYTVSSGALPSGVTLNTSSGLISGTAPIIASGATTYNFAVTAEDAELQDAPRSFSITINADAVTWNNPAGNTNVTANIGSPYALELSATSAAGKAITYSANTLPSGLTLSGSNITGSFASTGSTNSLITASAATTNKSANITLSYNITSPYMEATGGTITTSGNYKIHTFTGTGTFEITTAPVGSTVEVLIVAGGGAGSYAYAGGGGAGGVLYGALSSATGSWAVTVGAGGTYDGSGPTTTNGSNSSVVFNGTTYTAIGGGAGGGWWTERQAGGSGGGAGGVAGVGSTSGGAALQTSQSPLTGYGNAGGGASRSSNQPGGGGGGAGAAGVFGGAGGAGIANPITGSTVGQLSSGTYYIAGGGGGTFGAGGLGGGGQGGNLPTRQPGTANTGGGGGGGYNNDGGSNGGSGVVIFRYQYL